MPFKKGHPGYPSRKRAISTRHLSAELRDNIPASIYKDFHLAVAMGRDAKIIEDSESDSGISVSWNEQGLAPTLEQRLASMRWLAERQYGQAPQMIQLEQQLRVETSQRPATNQIRGRSPAAIRALRDAVRALTSGPAAPPTDAIDAEFTDSSPSSGTPAPAGEQPATGTSPLVGQDPG